MILLMTQGVHYVGRTKSLKLYGWIPRC